MLYPILNHLITLICHFHYSSTHFLYLFLVASKNHMEYSPLLGPFDLYFSLIHKFSLIPFSLAFFSSYKNPVFSTQKQGIELLTLLLHLKLLLHHLSVLQNLVLTLSSSHTLFQLCSNLLTFQLFIMKIIQYLAQKQVIHSIGSNKDFLMSMRVIQK